LSVSKKNNESALLHQLAGNVEVARKENKKLHEVWDASFVPLAIGREDCRSNGFVWQKLNYMHNNSCSGKWQPALSPIEYIHSSAKFCLTGIQGIYTVINFMEMEEVNFNVSKE